jgi:hypothetical protein
MAKRGRPSLLGRPITPAERQQRSRWLRALFKQMFERQSAYEIKQRWLREGDAKCVAWELADVHFSYKTHIADFAMIAYGPSYANLYRRAAAFVDKIFKGAKPSDLPVEQPTRFELLINLKTAKALGLTIPPNLLSIAGEVIE